MTFASVSPYLLRDCEKFAGGLFTALVDSEYLQQDDAGTEAEAASLDNPSWSGIKCVV